MTTPTLRLGLYAAFWLASWVILAMVLAASFSSCNNWRDNKQGDGRNNVVEEYRPFLCLRATRAATVLSYSCVASKCEGCKDATPHHFHVFFDVNSSTQKPAHIRQLYGDHRRTFCCLSIS